MGGEACSFMFRGLDVNGFVYWYVSVWVVVYCMYTT